MTNALTRHLAAASIRPVRTLLVTSLAAGESVVAVAERLGNEDATMVLTVYGHLLPDSEDRTRKAVDAAWTTARRAPRRPPLPRDGPNDLDSYSRPGSGHDRPSGLRFLHNR